MKLIIAALAALTLVGCTSVRGPVAGGRGATACSVGTELGGCETRCDAGFYATCDGTVEPPVCKCKPV